MKQSEHGISEADEIKVQKIPNKVYEAELYRLPVSYTHLTLPTTPYV